MLFGLSARITVRIVSRIPQMGDLIPGIIYSAGCPGTFGLLDILLLFKAVPSRIFGLSGVRGYWGIVPKRSGLYHLGCCCYTMILYFYYLLLTFSMYVVVVVVSAGCCVVPEVGVVLVYCSSSHHANVFTPRTGRVQGRVPGTTRNSGSSAAVVILINWIIIIIVAFEWPRDVRFASHNQLRGAPLLSGFKAFLIIMFGSSPLVGS